MPLIINYLHSDVIEDLGFAIYKKDNPKIPDLLVCVSSSLRNLP